MSRRAADTAVAEGRVWVDGAVATPGTPVPDGATVRLDDQSLQLPPPRTILLHKPIGYVTSRRQQGANPTIYKLLPPELHDLKPIGRLDKDSSGLLLLTNDGGLAQTLQHPSRGKWKVYQVELTRPLTGADRQRLERGIELDDGLSRLELSGAGRRWAVRLQEGRNRQIRRSFTAAGYRVKQLHRTEFGDYRLGSVAAGAWQDATSS